MKSNQLISLAVLLQGENTSYAIKSRNDNSYFYILLYIIIKVTTMENIKENKVNESKEGEKDSEEKI